MKENMISVIVPVYKVEQYLPRCIDSILAQTYKNLEIILVDDGSPDNCPQICDEYAKRDKRIKVIHKENGGLSDARNAGIEVATGEYIGFVDSDDFIEKEMYEEMVVKIEKMNAEIALCKINFVYDNGEKEYLDEVDLVNGCDGGELVQLFLKNDCVHKDEKIIMHGLTWSVCRCLFSRKLIERKRFIKHMISEDFFFNIEVFSEAKGFAIVDKGFYNYYQRTGSTTKVFDKKKIERRIDFAKMALKTILKEVNDEDYQAFSFYLYESLVWECINADNYRELLKKIKKDKFLNKLNKFKNCKMRMKSLTNKKKKLSCILIYLKWFGLYRKLYFKYKNTK